jgi:hypothetical protein
MNALQLVLAFVPWISFGLLAGETMESLSIALFAGLILTVVLGYKGIRKGYLFPVVSLGFFVVTSVLVVLFHNVVVATYLGMLAYGTLSVLAWGSIIARHPFTIDYARESVSEERRNTPLFYSVNLTLTTVWAVLLTIDLGMAGLKKVIHGWGLLLTIIPWVCLASGIVFTLWYPGYARARSVPHSS